MNLRKTAVLLVVLMLVATACGGDDSAETTTTTEATTTTTTTTTTEPPTTTSTTEAEEPSEAELALQASLARSGEVTSGRMEGSFEIVGIEGMPGGGSFEMPFSGAFDNEAGAFAFSMDLSGMAGLGAEGEEIPPELSGMLGEFEVRTIGDAAYMKYPFFTAFLGVETEWIQIPAEDAGTATPGFPGVSPANPTDFLDVFEGADITVEDLGREIVGDDVETTHYRVLVDVERLLEEASKEELADLEELGQLPFGELPTDMWVGDDGLVYRFVIEIDGSAVEAEPGEGFEKMVMSFEMSDLGEPVNIEAPDPDEVTVVDDLEGLFGVAP